MHPVCYLILMSEGLLVACHNDIVLFDNSEYVMLSFKLVQ